MRHERTNAQCITANAYACLELNAHGLVLAVRSCRDRRHPEQFLVTHYGSQHVEGAFRSLRSMTTMYHTQTNFTFKELSEKLRRVHMLQQIEYRNRERYHFPNQGRSQETSPYLPTDFEIKTAINDAQAAVSRVWKPLGYRGQSSHIPARLKRRERPLGRPTPTRIGRSARQARRSIKRSALLALECSKLKNYLLISLEEFNCVIARPTKTLT